jgi:hypothetical protein
MTAKSRKPQPFNPDAERRKLIDLYLKLRSIIESTLKRMESDPEKLSAALIDVAVKSIRQLAGLLDELEKADEARKRKEEAEKAREDARRSLPAPIAGRVVNTRHEPEEKIELPFTIALREGLNVPLKG